MKEQVATLLGTTTPTAELCFGSGTANLGSHSISAQTGKSLLTPRNLTRSGQTARTIFVTVDHTESRLKLCIKLEHL